MKRLILCLVVALCVCLCACGKTGTTDVWLDAVYTEDTELGQGSNTLQVEVVAEEKSVTFTIHTDEKILGDALVEHNLIEGEQGPYGLYVKKVNGILADYDKTKSYWGLNKNGEGMLTGVDGAEIADGDHFELVYTVN